MDLNYLLAREQHALHMAEKSRSRSARAAHRAFAHAYGLILAASGFPHRFGPEQTERRDEEEVLDERARVSGWENEGGSYD